MSALAILLSSDGTHIQSFSITEDGNGTVGGSIGEHGSGGSTTEDGCGVLLEGLLVSMVVEGVLLRIIFVLVRMVMALLEGALVSMVVMVYGRSIAKDGSGPVASFQDPSSFHHLQYRKVETGYITNKANCSPTLAGHVAAYLRS